MSPDRVEPMKPDLTPAAALALLNVVVERLDVVYRDLEPVLQRAADRKTASSNGGKHDNAGA